MSLLKENTESFLQACRAKNLSEQTVRWYEWLLTGYGQYVVERVLPWDSPDTIEGFLAHLAKRGVKPNTVHAYFRALRRLFNWLEKRGRIASNPMHTVESPRLPRHYPRSIGADDVEKLLSSIGTESPLGKRDKAIILFLWDTGVRAGELCALSLNDVDLEHQKALVRDGKGGKSRYVSFGVRVKEALQEWLAVRSAQCGRLFVNKYGQGLTISGLSSMLRRHGEKAGVGTCNPHSFRHGFAVAYLDNGGGIHNLRLLMGHATLRSTEQYLWVTDGRAAQDHAQASPADHLHLEG